MVVWREYVSEKHSAAVGAPRELLEGLDVVTELLFKHAIGAGVTIRRVDTFVALGVAHQCGDILARRRDAGYAAALTFGDYGFETGVVEVMQARQVEVMILCFGKFLYRPELENVGSHAGHLPYFGEVGDVEVVDGEVYTQFQPGKFFFDLGDVGEEAEESIKPAALHQLLIGVGRESVGRQRQFVEPCGGERAQRFARQKIAVGSYGDIRHSIPAS